MTAINALNVVGHNPGEEADDHEQDKPPDFGAFLCGGLLAVTRIGDVGASRSGSARGKQTH